MTLDPLVVVLVVEDDPLVRLTALDIIQDAGFETLEARDADEAIALLESHPEIQILFTDIDMPGSMNGVKLAVCVRDRWPLVHILVTSGQVARADAAIPLGSGFISKPYLANDLASRLAAFV